MVLVVFSGTLVSASLRKRDHRRIAEIKICSLCPILGFSVFFKLRLTFAIVQNPLPSAKSQLSHQSALRLPFFLFQLRKEDLVQFQE